MWTLSSYLQIVWILVQAHLLAKMLTIQPPALQRKLDLKLNKMKYMYTVPVYLYISGDGQRWKEPYCKCSIISGRREEEREKKAWHEGFDKIAFRPTINMLRVTKNSDQSKTLPVFQLSPGGILKYTWPLRSAEICLSWNFLAKCTENTGLVFPRNRNLLWFHSKWFELRSISSLCSVIVRVSVVLKRTVGDSDWRFDNLSGRHLQSHCDIVSSVDGIYVSGYWPDWSIKLSCYWL